MQATGLTVVTEEARKSFAQVAKQLFASTMYPFQSLQLMLLVWQRGEQADQELSDSGAEDEDTEGQDCNATGSAVRYSTQKAYESRIAKIDNHNAWLGVELLFKCLPALETWLKEAYNDKFVTKMGNDATKQHGTHTNNIKGDILSYLQPSNTESLGYSVPLNLSKEERGLHHHGTARFLIPCCCLEDFEKDPASLIARFIDDEDHDHSLIAEEWPTFLYDEYAGWNEKDVRHGLFCGHVLVRVALRIFRNTTAAHADVVNKPYDPKLKAKGPTDILRRCNITEVTPRMIAYAAVQAYIGLSSIPMWGDAHGMFNLIHFYHLIVKTLLDETNDWVVQTLAWWKSKIFGNRLSGNDSTAEKRIRITTNTAYKLMVKQGKQDEQNDQLEYVYPKWLHRWGTHPTSASSGENPPNITTAQVVTPAHQADDELADAVPQPTDSSTNHKDTTSSPTAYIPAQLDHTPTPPSSSPPPQPARPQPKKKNAKRSQPVADGETDDVGPDSTSSSKRPRLCQGHSGPS